MPNNILRSGEDVFLDDYTLEDVQNALQTEIVIAPSDGKGLVNAVLSGVSERKNNGNFVYIQAFDK